MLKIEKNVLVLAIISLVVSIAIITSIIIYANNSETSDISSSTSSVSYDPEADENLVPSIGIIYTPINKNAEYSVTGSTIELSGRIVIAGVYNGRNVVKIEESAFEDNDKITSVVIQNGVVDIEINAFKDCDGITSVSIPSSVMNIKESAFEGCVGLKNVKFSSGINDIGERAFYGCEKLKELSLPKTLTKLGAYAFYGCTSLESVNLPPNLLFVSKYAFSNCTNLATVETSVGVATFDEHAFSNCTSLAEIYLPKSITTVSNNTFFNCFALTIFADVAVKPEHWQDNWNSSNCPIVWNYKSNSLADDGKVYSLVNGVRFSIEINGAYVINQPTNIKKANIPQTVTHGSEIFIVKGIKENAFQNCTALEEVTIPQTVTAISSNAFCYLDSLKSIYIPSTVYLIESNAFNSCKNLTINVESASKPDGWVDSWAGDVKNIEWGKTENNPK